jgi:two-component system nitrate/nitrite sensor histidine kinase NarX
VASEARGFDDRAATEATLRASDERFRGLFEQAPSPKHLFAPDGRSVRVNRAYTALWGLTEEDLAGLNVFDSALVARKGLLPYLRRAFDGEPTVVPPMAYTPEEVPGIAGGRPHWLRVFINPIRDGAGAIREVLVHVEDVTDQQEAQAALREREGLYRDIFEATGDGLYIRDVAGRIVEANPAFCAMHGYASEELIGRPVVGMVHPDHRVDLEPHSYTATMVDGPPATERRLHLRRDGAPFPVEARDRAVTYRGQPHLLGLVRDISERVRAYESLEARVAERTRELSALLQVARDMAATLDRGTLLGTILDGLKELIGYSAASILTLEGDALVQVDRRGPDPGRAAIGVRFPLDLAGAVWGRLAAGEPVLIRDVRGDDTPEARDYRAAIGAATLRSATYLHSWLAVPLLVRDRAIGLLALMYGEPDHYTPRDVELATAFAGQAAVAIENARLYARARELATLAERQRLARELHDAVTQTLFSASITAEVLPRLLDRDPDAARRGAEDLRQLTRGALAEMRTLLVELRPAALTEAPLGDLLRQLVEALEGRKRLAATLTVTGRRPLPPQVQVALYRIAQEALHNAAKHARASNVAVALRRDDAGATLRIADDGRGFDPLRVGGDHFGLGIMRERAAAVGARLAIASQPDEGTTITAEWRDPGPEG